MMKQLAKEKRGSIIKDQGKEVLQVKYLKGKIGPTQGGLQKKFKLDKKHDEYWVEYSVKFNKKFNFLRGGKLPGLVGGTMPVGGEKSLGGFSARIMWRKKGSVYQYLYYEGKDPSMKWGEDLAWNVKFKPGKWHRLKTRIKMNTPGRKDGIIQSWFDGKKILDKKIMFRAKGSKFRIDAFNFTTFFGGNDKTWAPKKNEFAYFKDLILSEKRLK